MSGNAIKRVIYAPLWTIKKVLNVGFRKCSELTIFNGIGQKYKSSYSLF